MPMPGAEGRNGPVITIKTGKIINTKGHLERGLPEGQGPQEVPVAGEQEGGRCIRATLPFGLYNQLTTVVLYLVALHGNTVKLS